MKKVGWDEFLKTQNSESKDAHDKLVTYLSKNFPHGKRFSTKYEGCQYRCGPITCDVLQNELGNFKSVSVYAVENAMKVLAITGVIAAMAKHPTLTHIRLILVLLVVLRSNWNLS